MKMPVLVYDDAELVALIDILNELQEAESRYPQWPTDPIHAVAIMAEEAGEAVQAANNLVWHGGDREALRDEIVQTAAMAIRCLKNL